MKAKAILLSLALATAALAPVVAGAQCNPLNGSNPGVALSSSSSIEKLPQAALKFINKYYNGTNVAKVERDYSPNGYDVKLANGVDIEFDTAGNVREIDAPDGTALSTGVVKALLTPRAFANLSKQGKAGNVESIDFTYNSGRLTKVETIETAPVDIVFDNLGNVVLMEVDD